MQIDDIIKRRKTQKVLADKPWLSTQSEEALRKTINELLDLANYAPYHKKCHEKYCDEDRELNSCVPWRFYVLDTKACRKLYDFIKKEEIKAGIISNMLAAADSMIIANWLPDTENTNSTDSFTEEPIPYMGNLKNMEHIAACSTAVQNLLIGATARNIPNYWSSGGQLRKVPLRNYLNIPMDEILLGAIFLFPEDAAKKTDMIKPGANRNEGKDISAWSKWV